MKHLSLHLFAAVLVAPTLLAMLVAGAAVREVGEVKPQQLVYLGRVGGKTYFWKGSSEMNWEQASTYCNSANMVLGTIENVEERKFVVDAIRERIGATDIEWVWTDGVEKSRTTTFVWNTTQTHAWNVTTTVNTPADCLLLEVEKTQDRVFPYMCRGSPRLGALCQALN